MKNNSLQTYLNFSSILSILLLLFYYENITHLKSLSFLYNIMIEFPEVKLWISFIPILFLGISFLNFFYFNFTINSLEAEHIGWFALKWICLIPISTLILLGNKIYPALILYLYPVSVLVYFFILKSLQYPNQTLTNTPAPLSIKSEKRKVENESSFHWKTDNGIINVVNPFQGILIVGGAGSGKTYSLIQEIISQALKKGYTGFIYDYKYPELSDFTYDILLKSPPKEIHSYYINFTDLTKSHRVNPLHPRNLPISLFANEYAMVIMKSIKKEWVHKQDFWADNSIAYLKSIIWFLRKHEPEYCTLPHVISIALQEYSWVLEMLATDLECKSMISSLWTAYKENAAAQIAGCISSLQNPLDKLNNPNLFYVLSGDEVPLHLNQSNHPALLCIGNHPNLSDSLNPIISLVASVVMKNLNVKGKLKSIFLLDEAPTLYLPNLKDLPNTGRSNLISTIYCCQDFSQMDLMYGKDEAKVIRASLGNQFLGMVNDFDTSFQISQLFGKEEKTRKLKNQSQSYSSSEEVNQSSGFSYNTYEKEVLKPNAALSFPPGYFVGKVTSTKKPFFAGRPRIMDRLQSDGLKNFRNFSDSEVLIKGSSQTAINPCFADGSENELALDDNYTTNLEINQQNHLDLVIQWNYRKIFQEAEDILVKHNR